MIKRIPYIPIYKLIIILPFLALFVKMMNDFSVIAKQNEIIGCLLLYFFMPISLLLVFTADNMVSMAEEFVEGKKKPALINYLENRGFVNLFGDYIFSQKNKIIIKVSFNEDPLYSYRAKVYFFKKHDLDVTTNYYQEAQEKIEKYFTENNL